MRDAQINEMPNIGVARGFDRHLDRDKNVIDLGFDKGKKRRGAGALDPKTGEAVMQMTARLIEASRLAAIMVTHNMQEAIRWGNRLVMMHEGRIILDVEGATKTALSISGLIEKFHEASRGDLIDDRMLLTP